MSVGVERKEICRLCLDKNVSLISVFDSFPNEIGNFPLKNKISVVLSIEVTKEDKFTTKICHGCCQKVVSFYNFHRKAGESQKLLAQWELELEEEINAAKNQPVEKVDKFVTSVLESSATSGRQEKEDQGHGQTTQHNSENPCDNAVATDYVDVLMTPDTSTIDTSLIDGLDQSKQTGETRIENDRRTKTKPSNKNQQKQKGLSQNITEEENKTENPDNTNQTFSVTNLDKGIKKFICSVCPYSSASSGNFKIHMMKHNKIYLVKCKDCGKGFYNKTFYREHKLKKHSNEITVYKCDGCNKVYHSSSYLQQHMKIHSPDYVKKDYQCEHCGKTFLSWKGVKRHILIVHRGSKYKCDICEKEVTSLQSLNNHKKIHSGEKRFVCNICGKGFIGLNNLVVHQRIHSGERPYKCDLCDKSFSQCSTLKVHQRFHSGERPYPCSACTKRFVTRTLLRVHEKSHQK